MSDRSLRGMRLGAQSMETESGVEPAPRQRVEYRCEDGEQVFVTFSSEAEIPPVWVSKTGKEALAIYQAQIEEEGQDSVCRLQTSPAQRHFCSRCASALWPASVFETRSRAS